MASTQHNAGDAVIARGRDCLSLVTGCCWKPNSSVGSATARRSQNLVQDQSHEPDVAVR